MQPTLCPWCQAYGLVTVTKTTSSGLEVDSHCTICNSNCHSLYNPGEVREQATESPTFVQAGQRGLAALILEMLQQ